MATTTVRPTGPVEFPGQESAIALRRITPQAETLATRNYLPEVDPEAVEQAMMIGDLSKMTPDVRIAYYVATCRSVGLNPLTRPFQALKADDGSILLYPDKGCAEQLRKRDKVSLRIVSREYVDDLYIVTVEASTLDGRKEESEGVVVVLEAKGTWETFTNRTGETKRFKKEQLDAQGNPIMVRLKGMDMANARMRCETKAKRRATLAICGLGMPDAGEGHPMRFDPQQGTLEEGDAARDAEVVDVTPLRATEQAKTKDDHIEDLTGHRPQAATRPAGSAADYVPQIEAIISTANGDPAVFWPWAERQLKKPQAEFSPKDYADLLTRAESQAAQRKAERAQAAMSAASVSVEVSDAHEANSGHPDAKNGQSEVEALPDEYANVDPETGEVFDLQANAAVDCVLDARELDEADPF